MSTDRVRLAIPASGAYLSLARAATAGICARLDFPIDRLEDVGLAVDEAASLLLLDAVPDTELVIQWQPSGDGLAITIESVSSSGRTPRTTTFAWTVLSALASEVSAELDSGHVRLTLRADRDEVPVP